MKFRGFFRSLLTKISLLWGLLLKIYLPADRYAKYRGVKLGQNCRIYIKNWGSEPFLIEIGNRVTITSGVRFLTHDGGTWLIRDTENSRYQKYGRINISDNVFVGVNSVIMPGISIGSNVIVGAGSIVTKDIPSDSVVAGNPAKLICSYSSYEGKIKASCPNDRDINIVSDYVTRIEKALVIQKEKARDNGQ